METKRINYKRSWKIAKEARVEGVKKTGRTNRDSSGIKSRREGRKI